VALARRAVLAPPGAPRYAVQGRHAGPARLGALAPRREEPVLDAAQVPHAARALRAQAQRAVPARLLLLYAVAPLRSSPLQRR
jgi:hypothetical protein